MEILITIKVNGGVQLSDRELAVRWWGRKSIEEKMDLLKTFLPKYGIEDIDYETMYWIWLRQQKL